MISLYNNEFILRLYDCYFHVVKTFNPFIIIKSFTKKHTSKTNPNFLFLSIFLHFPKFIQSFLSHVSSKSSVKSHLFRIALWVYYSELYYGNIDTNYDKFITKILPSTSSIDGVNLGPILSMFNLRFILCSFDNSIRAINYLTLHIN